MPNLKDHHQDHQQDHQDHQQDDFNTASFEIDMLTFINMRSMSYDDAVKAAKEEWDELNKDY